MPAFQFRISESCLDDCTHGLRKPHPVALLESLIDEVDVLPLRILKYNLSLK